MMDTQTDIGETLGNIRDILSGKSSIKTESVVKVDSSVYNAIGLVALLILFIVIVGIYANKNL